MRRSFTAAGLLVCAAGSLAAAGSFTSGNLVVMRVGGSGTGGSGDIILEEFTPGGSPMGNTLAFATSGGDALSLPDFNNHDRHLHRSTDGRFLVFTAYNGAPGATDYSGFGAAQYPRVIALVKYDGSSDLSTRLTSSFDFTGVRGAFTTDGTSIWIAGDNAGGATPSGGLRYTTLGSSTSADLSQVQVVGGAKTPDNVRDVGVFGGQLYDCSGSSSSIGKGAFSVGSGLPTSGSQTLVQLNPSDGGSSSSFVLLDLDASEPGVDVLYTAASAPAESIRKYVKTGGAWVFRGATTFAGVDHIVARPHGEAIEIFAASLFGVATFTDATPLTGMLSGSAPAFIVQPPAGYTIGGIDFSPEAPACPADLNGDGLVDFGDYLEFLNRYDAGDLSVDFNGDGLVDFSDYLEFLNLYDAGC